MPKIMTRTFFIAMLLLGITGCNALQSKDQMERFGETFLVYSKFLRWGDFHKAAAFSSPEHIAFASSEAPKLKNIRVTGVEALNWVVSEEKDHITGNIKISFYTADRGVINEIIEHQTWNWYEEAKTWKLEGGLPRLRH